MKKIICSLYCSALLLTACEKPPVPPPATQAANASLSGMAALSEAAKLDADAVLELTLTDVSGEDGAIEVARTQVKNVQFPAEFTLPYDSKSIKAQHRYTISARVLQAGQPQWVTDTAYPVITLGNPLRMDIQLVRSGVNAQSVLPSSDATTAIEGELSGAAGITTYRAYFQSAQLLRIEESQAKRRASYEYLGARLRHYSSQDDGAQTNLELRFDERGKLLSATQQHEGRTTAADTNAIDAARNRAALLRSHALATREIKEHERTAAQTSTTP